MRSIASSLATSQPHAVSAAVLLDKNPGPLAALEVTPGNPPSRHRGRLASSRGELDLVRLYPPIYYFAKTDTWRTTIWNSCAIIWCCFMTRFDAVIPRRSRAV